MSSSKIDLARDDLAIGRAFRFIGGHLPLVAVLCAISAVGRFVQTGWPSGTLAQVALEIIVEGARVLLALAAIGGGNPFRGVQMIKRFFRPTKSDQSSPPLDLGKRLRSRWKSYACDFALYCGIALALNLIISALVDTPHVVEVTHALGAQDNSSAAVFMKNLCVIPFTIIFQVFFVTRLLKDPGNESTQRDESA